MTDRLRKIPETWQMLLMSAIGMIVFLIGEIWPAIEIGVWTLFAAFLAGAMYRDLREPVNYKSLDFDATGFRHVGLGGVSDAA